jgi:hypothetical protein
VKRGSFVEETDMRKSLAIIILAAMWVLPVLAESPAATSGFASMGISFQSWKLENLDHPVQQTVLPILIFVPVQPGLYFSLSNTPGFSKFDQSKLNGLSDTYLRGTYVLPGERVMFNLGLGTPTGKTELTETEFNLSRALSETAFRFRLPLYGQGFHAKLGAAFAYPVNETTVLGGGLNYILKTAYKPMSEGGFDKFRPGNETSVFLGVDVKFAERQKWNLDLSYSFYGEDQIQTGADWFNVYGSGNRLIVNTSLIYGFEKGMAVGTIHWRQKGKNEIWDGVTWNKRRSGNQLEVELMTQLNDSEKLQYRFALEGRFDSKNEDETGGASIVGLGGGMSYSLSPAVSLNGDLRYLTGKLKSVVDVNVNGIDVMTGITFRF